MPIIKKYTSADTDALFAMLQAEGDEWLSYWYGSNRPRYQRVVENSITYLIYEDEALCGYARCRDDDGYGIYLLDLLVDKNHRGKNYGRMLMQQICLDHPGDDVYVTSDVDEYYEKQGCVKIGSVLEINPIMKTNFQTKGEHFE